MSLGASHRLSTKVIVAFITDLRQPWALRNAATINKILSPSPPPAYRAISSLPPTFLIVADLSVARNGLARTQITCFKGRQFRLQSRNIYLLLSSSYHVLKLLSDGMKTLMFWNSVTKWISFTHIYPTTPFDNASAQSSAPYSPNFTVTYLIMTLARHEEPAAHTATEREI